MGALIDGLEDEKTKEVLRRFIDYFETQNQMQDFVHLEIKTDTAQTNLKVRHNLGFIPKDVIKCKKVGAGDITMNYDKFDKDFLDVTTTGAVRLRVFVGTFIRDESKEADNQTETL